MNERVFEPLGITVGDTPRDGTHDLHWGFHSLDRPRRINGINRRPLGAGIHCNVEAMAKIGYLHLRRGRWQGRQIIPEEFADLVRRSDLRVSDLPVGSNEEGSRPGSLKHYGLLWWNNAEGNPQYARTDMLLARIPVNDLLNRQAVEFFAGTQSNPSWTSDINEAKPVFADPQAVNAHVSCTYNKPLDRYFLLTTNTSCR